MLDILLTVALGLVCVVGVILTALRLPGTWLIILAALGYGWWTDWARVGLVLMAVLVGVALAGEAIELLASAFTARKAGASKQAAIGGVAGGLVGMIFLSVPVFFPPIGTILGALIGCFAGAAIAEYSVRREFAQGTRVGFFSAVGFVLGSVTKTALALLMAAILLTSVVWPRAQADSPPDEASVVPGPTARTG
ncbi:MAG: DUF456 domain-containing protein [Phycisphaerae bacterium]|jgi:uncharacterized protein YqgC (DUF456 family)